MNPLLVLDRRTRAIIPATALLLVAGVGAIDWLHGQHLDLTIAYLTPVALAALLPAPGFGTLVAGCAAATRLAVAFAAGQRPWSLAAYAWNGVALFALGLFLVLLLAALRRALQEAHDAGRIDPLTGVADGSRFRELAEVEMTRTARYRRPLTLACLDVGALAADEGEAGLRRLRAIAETLSATLRKTDLVTRLDGGRFAVLLPETGQEAARAAVAKLQQNLATLAGEKRWSGGCRIGVVTCSRIPQSYEQLLALGGQVMLAAEASSRGAINYSHFDRHD